LLTPSYYTTQLTNYIEPEAFNFAPQTLPIDPLLAINRLGDSVGNFWPED
jgi:hypothetical protein